MRARRHSSPVSHREPLIPIDLGLAPDHRLERNEHLGDREKADRGNDEADAVLEFGDAAREARRAALKVDPYRGDHQPERRRRTPLSAATTR